MQPGPTFRRLYPRLFAAVAAALALSACELGGEPPDIGHTRQGATVSDYDYGTCSTSVVLQLSVQVAEEVGCIDPDALVPFGEGDGIEFSGSAVLPYMSKAAKDDLLAAAAGWGGTIRINSGFRTVVQQYLLYRWYQLGRCGITAAATPGNSNHESGRALDLANYGELRDYLPAFNFHQTVPGDPVHFDHLGSPDNRGLDVLAFQRLWNRNHPEDLIDEDGQYGPQTAARLAAAPAEGFPTGACSGGGRFDAELTAADVPPRIEPDERLVAWVELRNTGDEAWTPETTFLGTTGPRDRDSVFYDDENWVAPNRPTPVDAVTEPGATGRFSFVVNGPHLGEDALISETFGLVQEGAEWFGPEDITLDIEVRGGGTSLGDPGGDEGAPLELTGGCAAGGGGAEAASLLLAMAAVAGLWRRRRAVATGPCRRRRGSRP